MIALIDHLWQSTLCVGAAWLLTRLLKKNSAAIRHWIWFAASMKFLIPFSMLMAFGSLFDFGWHAVQSTPVSDSSVIVRWGGALTTPASSVLKPEFTSPSVSAQRFPLSYALMAVWLAGFFVLAVYRQYCRFQLSRLVGQARLLKRGREVDALRKMQLRQPWRGQVCLGSSRSTIEPGVHGIFDPTLLLPVGITDRLTDLELEMVIAHELSHLRRRDNVTAALHVVVETIFWFHPLVWWLGTRLVDERERGCDEEVLRLQSNPQAYAGAILKVCEFYLAPPLASVPGITSSNLRKRIEAILLNQGTVRLNISRKALLTTTGLAALSVPLVLGSISSPRNVVPSARVAFEVAEIKSNVAPSASTGVPEGVVGRDGGPPVWTAPGNLLVARNATALELIRTAYPSSPSGRKLEPWRVSGGRDWLRTTTFDINAKGKGVHSSEMPLVLQSLLADRFKFKAHWETKELPVYELTIAKGGAKLQSWQEGSCTGSSVPDDAPLLSPPPPSSSGTPRFSCGVTFFGYQGVGQMGAGKVTMAQMVDALESVMERTIVDKTGFSGTFNAQIVFNPLDEALPSFPGRDEVLVRQFLSFVRQSTLIAKDVARFSFFRVMEDQLGLRLESRQGPVEVLVIDKMDWPAQK